MVCVKLADLRRSCVKLTDSVLNLTNSQISQIRHIYTSVRDSRICEIDFVLKNLRRKSVENNRSFFEWGESASFPATSWREIVFGVTYVLSV
jgi:hypothetical protein